MDFTERVIPGISANYLFQESLARYIFASRLIKRSFKVLDVGCGSGYGTDLLAKKATVIGVDTDSEAIIHAREHYSKPIFKKGNAERPFFKDKKFDMVVSFEVIEHLKKPENLLREVKRVLIKNGTFILSTPNAEFPHTTKSPYHKREYRKHELTELLKRYFRKVEIYGQKKNRKALVAFKEFLKSQRARQKFVDSDWLKIRKFVPKDLKEWTWKYLGGLFGRSVQNKLKVSDFLITKEITEDTEFFVAVCRK